MAGGELFIELTDSRIRTDGPRDDEENLTPLEVSLRDAVRLGRVLHAKVPVVWE